MPASLMVAVLALSLSGCSAVLNQQHHRPLRMPQVCQDNLPVQVLQHQACLPDGFCGWSCLPDRWEV